MYFSNVFQNVFEKHAFENVYQIILQKHKQNKKHIFKKHCLSERHPMSINFQTAKTRDVFWLRCSNNTTANKQHERSQLHWSIRTGCRQIKRKVMFLKGDDFDRSRVRFTPS